MIHSMHLLYMTVSFKTTLQENGFEFDLAPFLCKKIAVSFAVATYDSSLSNYSPSVIIDIFSGMYINNFFIDALAPIDNNIIIDNKHYHYTTATRCRKQLL